MQDIAVIILCIGLGMAVGHFLRARLSILRVADKASQYAVYVLLFLLGTKLGGDADLMAHLAAIGSRALVISLCCTAGSVLCLGLAGPLFPRSGARPAADCGKTTSPLKGSLRILLFFTLGVALGGTVGLPDWLSNGMLATYALFFLVFAVGIGLGSDLRAFGIVRDLHVKILLVPLLIILGTAAGSVAAAALLPDVSVRDALCVGAGLGYYSLSSFLIENAGDSVLASIALLANILRELTAILAAPLLARHFGRFSTVAAAGATAMDTTLPIIARFSGEYAAVVAVFSGMTLTLLVPFLVTGLLRLL